MIKHVVIGDSTIELISEDGKRWVSRPRDLASFKWRQEKWKKYLQRYFSGKKFDVLTEGVPEETFHMNIWSRR